MREILECTRSNNVHYKTTEIANYFSKHRRKWEEFYPSERWIFQLLIDRSKGSLGRILDVGCAGGGLYDALASKSSIASYLGIDINRQVVEIAKSTHEGIDSLSFECTDILNSEYIKSEGYDLVCSLSCADWNIDTSSIINTCWNAVKPGGHLIISLRLTSGNSINDVSKSYQYIYYEDRLPEAGDEIANYVVFNAKNAIDMLLNLNHPASELTCYGSWGKPSRSAQTPFKDLVFAVFLVKKSLSDDFTQEAKIDLKIPSEVLAPNL